MCTLYALCIVYFYELYVLCMSNCSAAYTWCVSVSQVFQRHTNSFQYTEMDEIKYTVVNGLNV